MRKHVKPTHPLAVIQDMERGKRLPPEGASVAWTPYYAKLEARGDIEVVPDPTATLAVADAGPAPVPEVAPEPAPGTDATAAPARAARPLNP